MPTTNSAGAALQQWRSTSAPKRSETAGAGIDVGRLVWLGVAVGVVALFANQLPDLRRYMNMRRM